MTLCSSSVGVSELINENAEECGLRLAIFADDAERGGGGFRQQIDRGLKQEVPVVMVPVAGAVQKLKEAARPVRFEIGYKVCHIPGAILSMAKAACLGNRRANQFVFKVCAQFVETQHLAGIVVLLERRQDRA